MLMYLGHVGLLSASALPDPASYPRREDRARAYDYPNEYAKPPSIHRRRPPQLLRTAHMAHRRHSSALSSRPYPSPESETEPLYLHTLTHRVANRYGESAQTSLIPEREERYEAEDNVGSLQNLSVRVKPGFERSDNWTPKHQDSIISSWVNALSSLFSTNKANNSAQSPSGAMLLATSTAPQQEDGPDDINWNVPNTVTRYNDRRSPGSSRYDTTEDVREEERRVRSGEDGFTQDRIDSRSEYANPYENSNQKVYSGSDDLRSQRQRQRTRRERDLTQRMHHVRYDTPNPRRNVYADTYTETEADIDDDGRQEIEIRREVRRQPARHRPMTKGQGSKSSVHYGRFREGDESMRPRYESRDTRDSRNLYENTGRGYSGGYMHPPPEDDNYYRREDQGVVGIANDRREDEGANDATGVENEPITDDRNAAMSIDRNIPPLSRTETREMVQLFRRLFDTLDNTLDGPEHEYRKRAIQGVLPDVHEALAEAEKLNTQRDLDRKVGIGEDSNVDLNRDMPMRMAEERDNDAGDNSSPQYSQASGDVEKGRDIEKDVPADADFDESLRGVPPSSPAYGTRRKLLRQKSKGFIGGLYDIISSSISAII